MSDFNGITRLQEEQEKTLKNCEVMIEKWEKFKEDYEAVDKLLNDLPKKTTHDIMVPMGPLAFMPGKLVHTNEIMVLLGDNWFAERSATQAVEIAKRRLKSVEEYLGSLRKEHENILSHMAFTTDVVNMRSQNDFQEIKEELTEKDIQRQDTKSQRVAHAKARKHSVKKVDLQDTPTSNRTQSKEDENLFARLEELERQERTNNELENEQYFLDSTASSTIDKDESTIDESTLAQSTCLRAGNKASATSSNDKTCSNKGSVRNPNTFEVHKSSYAKSCSFVPQKENMRATNACTTRNVQKDSLRFGHPCMVEEVKNDSDTKHLVKKVKWKENVVEDQGVEDRVAYPKERDATIHFTHSSVTPRQSAEQSISSPADILADYLNRMESTGQHPNLEDEHVATASTSEITELKKATKTQEEKETMPQAFSNVVIEHKDISIRSATSDSDKNKEQKTESRKVSKFKASRMKND